MSAPLDSTCPACGRRSQGDVERDIGLEAEVRAVKHAQRQTDDYRRQMLLGDDVRARHRRSVYKALEEMVWRFESYDSAMACARELSEFVRTLPGEPKKPGRQKGYRKP